MFVHVVFMKFKDSTVIPTAKIRLEELRDTVPSIVELEVGIDILHTKRSKDLVLITRFKDQAGYERYVVDTNHQVVLAWLKTQLIESSTVDYIQ